MISDKITVFSSGNDIEMILDEAERFATYNRLGEKERQTLRLLTEEMIGALKGAAGDFEGDFWMECEKEEYRLKLRVEADMNAERKKELMALSTSGKNESSIGLFGLIRQVAAKALLGSNEEAAEIPNSEDLLYMGGMLRGEDSLFLDYNWSILQYHEALDGQKEKQAAKEEWDELEKSVLVRLADDIRVGVRGDNVEISVIKRFR